MNDLLPNLTSEEKLLLLLCRLDFSEEQKSEIRNLMKEIKDWDHFVDLSNKHGVIALCWFNITETGNGEKIPSGHLDKMHSVYLKNLTRNTFLFNQLEEISSLAKKENIKIVLLKGMALEKTAYGNKGLRQMTDIDLLVRQDQAALLRRVMLNNGYKSAPLVSKFHERIMPAYGKHLPEMYKNGIAVEIHFKLFDEQGNQTTEELFTKAYKLNGNNNYIYYPDPQLFFLYLLKHLDKHEKDGVSQLRLYNDLNILLVTHSDLIINNNLFECAKRTYLESVLAEKLNILNIYWELPLSNRSRTLSEKTNHEFITQKFISFLRHPNKNHHEEEQKSLLNLLKEVPRITDRFLLFTGHIFPSLAYIKHRYKIKTTVWAIMYYPARWASQIRILVKRRRV